MTYVERDSIRVGLAQFAATDDKAANVRRAEELVKECATAGAQIVGLQELYNTIYFPAYPPEDRFFDLAEPLEGPTLTRMRELARELNVMVLAPIYEELPGGRLFNTAALIDATGRIAGIWRKIHIPRVRVHGSGWKELDEKLYFEPSTAPHQVLDTPLGRIGVVICHDRHFPETARCLALDGAELVFAPSASRGIPEVADPVDVWTTEIRGLAIQNMYFICGINRVGTEHGEVFLGHSIAVGPDGEILAMAGFDEGVLLVDLNLSVVRRTRIARGFLRDRRPDTYGALIR